jgi:hypothetical protein
MPNATAWKIRTSSGQVLFQGSREQCEDWLDWNENTLRQAVELEMPSRPQQRARLDNHHSRTA